MALVGPYLNLLLVPIYKKFDKNFKYGNKNKIHPV
jgi:hypothetical protein